MRISSLFTLFKPIEWMPIGLQMGTACPQKQSGSVLHGVLRTDSIPGATSLQTINELTLETVASYRRGRYCPKSVVSSRVKVLTGCLILGGMLPNGCMIGMIKNIIKKAPIKTPKDQKKGNTTLFAGEPGTAFPFIFDHQAAMGIVTPRIITV